MYNPNSASTNQADNNHQRRWLPLVLILLFFAVLTSSLAGYILGKQAASAPLGQIIDTILLAPEDETAETAFHLSGRVFYSNGTPAAGQILELHSEPMTTVSDSQGGFLFPNVPEGEHTIMVMGAGGAIAAQQEIVVSRTDGAHNAAISLLDGSKYAIELSVDVRVLEIEIQMDENVLQIDQQHFSYGTADGYVFTPAGAASVSDGTIVTPGGNIYLPDGHVVFPGGSASDPTQILLPDDTLLTNEPLSAGDTTIAADGTVTLPDGTQIQPGGQIQTPDGRLETPGENGVVVDSEKITPIGGSAEADLESGRPAVEPETRPEPPAQEEEPANPPAETVPPAGLPEETQPPASEEKPPVVTPPVQEPTTPPLPPQEQPPEPDNPGGGSIGGGGGGGSVTPPPTPPPSTDNGELTAAAETADGFVEWQQHRLIDLFYNRETQTTESIAPGCSGYYLFRLQNTRQETLTLTLSLAAEEGSPYLPLTFTLHPQGVSSGAAGTLAKDETLTLKTTIDGGADTVYQLDWQWPLDGHDAVDTEAGRQGGQYQLLLTIHAEGKD